MKKIIIIFFLFTLNSLTAQVNQEWVATYNGKGTGSFYADKNAIDNSGNLIVAGRSVTQSIDYLVLKYNTSGVLLWSRTYDGVNHNTDWLSDMILDDSGNVYITGRSKEGINGDYNWLTIKYSPDGDLRWKKSLDWTMHKEDIPFSITLDKDRNVFVAGYGWALPAGFENFDIVVAKYNNNGEEQWKRSFDSPPYHSDWGYSVVTDDSGSAYVSGYTYPSKVATIKYDEDGNEIWVREYPRMSGEYAIPLFSKIDKQYNIIVNNYYQVSGQSNFVTLKYDRNGNLLWDRIFDSPEGTNDFAQSIYIDDSSNIYVGGSTQGTATYYDFLLLKYSPTGDTLWKQTYDDGFGGSDIANSIAVDMYYNVYLTGSTYTSSNDFLTIKYNSDGKLDWFKNYSSPNNNISYSICLDKNNNVFISGYVDININSSVLISIKYSQLTYIKPNNLSTINDFNLYSFPNPFNPNTSINYKLKTESNVKLVIFDVTGREVSTLINKKQNSGNNKIFFDGSNLNSGIFFCKLTINGINSETIKMLLLK